MSADTATTEARPAGGQWTGVTDADVPLIGWSISADLPRFAYLADPDASRPATEAELAATEAAAYQEYAAAMAANAAIGTAPRGPWPVARAAVTAPGAAAAELTVTPGDYLDGREDEGDIDLPRLPGPIAQMAAEANGLGELDKAQEVAFTAFSGAFDADPEGDGDRAQPDATAHLAAVGDDTQVTPAVTEVQS